MNNKRLSSYLILAVAFVLLSMGSASANPFAASASNSSKGNANPLTDEDRPAQGSNAVQSNNYSPSTNLGDTTDSVKQSDFDLEMDGQTYRQVNLQNLFDLALMVGSRSLDDEYTLADYARVHYCEIYQDFYENEYQWLNVSKGIKNDFSKKVDDIPRHYFFRADIEIDRYDPDIRAFPFSRTSKLENVGRVQFYTFSETQEVCGLYGFDEMPSVFFLNPTNRINLSSLKIDSDEELKQISLLPKNYKGNRTIYAVFFFTINGYDLVNENAGNLETVDLLGSIDRIVYYEDPYLEVPIKVADF